MCQGCETEHDIAVAARQAPNDAAVIDEQVVAPLSTGAETGGPIHALKTGYSPVADHTAVDMSLLGGDDDLGLSTCNASNGKSV